MNKAIWVIILLFFCCTQTYAGQTLSSSRTETVPVIDGIADESWNNIKGITSHDPLANIDITVKSVYTDDHIYFIVQFPDETENWTHKTFIWDPILKLYKVGPQREDAFVIKWNMDPTEKELSLLTGEQPYKADIWYWKSHRTDHAGYADDKYQIYSQVALSKAQTIVTQSGKIFYLVRRGDQGSAAYKNLVESDFKEAQMPSFQLITPTGSRADIRAKGVWNNGTWTIEFSRKLSTGNSDDIAFDPDKKYQFGISRYEIAGRKPNPKIEQPMFGSGDITENLYLEFK